MSGGHDIAQVAIAVFFISIALALGGLLYELSKKIKIPYPALVFIFGITVGSQYTQIHDKLIKESVHLAFTLKSNTLLSLFIPVLVFYSAFTTDIYIIKKQIFQILFLSIPSLIIQATLIAIAIKIPLEYSDDFFTWSFAFIFGTVISCTDTFQVVKLLNEAEAPKKFTTLVQGESLVNNCASMIIMLMAIRCSRLHCGFITEQTQFGLTVFLGGILIGVGFGLLTVWWIRRVNHNAILTINLTIVSAYLTYFIAESIDLGFQRNGLVAVITLGLFMSANSKIRIRTDCEHPLDIFWRYVTFSAETIIFLITGLVSGYKIYDSHSPNIYQHDYFKLLLLYASVLGAKLAATLILLPLVNKVGAALRLSEAFLFTYSGARGAVQLILALVVFQDPAFSDHSSDIFLFQTTGIVILTLIINGSTTSGYVRFMGLSGSIQGKARVKLNFLQEMKDQTELKLNQMKQEYQHKNINIDWKKVSYFAGIDETSQQIQNRDQKLQKQIQIEEKQKLKSQQSSIESKFAQHLKKQDSHDTIIEENDIDEDAIIETRDRFLMALKQTYWDLYSQNQCGGKAYALLIESVRWDLDTVTQRMCSFDFLYNLFYSPLYMRFLYWLIKLPFIGSYAGGSLFHWVSMGYEVLSTYVKAHEEMEMMIEAFPIPQLLQRLIAKESKENRTNAENFIEAYLQASFPEIIKLIQTKKAAQSCLASQSKYIERKYQLGEIDQQEALKLKLQLNDFVCAVEDIMPIWSKVSIFEKLKNNPIFEEFDSELLKQVSQQSIELVFDKDECITREGDLARYIYIITRGSAVETTQNTFNSYTCVREVNDIISPHHIALQATIYLTQSIADSLVEVIQIEIELMIKLFKVSKKIQQLIWSESLYALSRFYAKELHPLNQLEKATIEALGDLFDYQKYRAGSNLQIQAGILLSGKVVVEHQDSKKDDPQIEFEQKDIKFGPMLFPFRNEQHKLTTDSICTFFIFDPSKKDEILKQLAQERSLERAKSRFLPDNCRILSSNVNRQSFGFSYLLRPSKIENTESKNQL